MSKLVKLFLSLTVVFSTVGSIPVNSVYAQDDDEYIEEIDTYAYDDDLSNDEEDVNTEDTDISDDKETVDIEDSEEKTETEDDDTYIDESHSDSESNEAVEDEEENAPEAMDEINLEGYTPPDYDSGIATYASYASSYSSKTTSIRNQGSWGTCWSFATMAQAETYMLANKGTTLDLSERQLAYFYYNNVDDPLGNNPNDSTTLSSGYKFYNAGGNPYGCYLFLSGYCGITNETNVPYSTSDTSATDSKYAFGYNNIVLDNAYFLGDNASDNTVKQAIMDYGGVNAMYYYDANYYKSSNGAYYYTKSGDVNHAICIVGWDDNYSKSNFKTQPSGNGAWKVKNSWGTSSGDSGYDWISYYDASLSGFIAADYSSDAYDYNYHYDGTGGMAYVTASSGYMFANNYEVKNSNQELEAVSFALNSTNAKYTIQIYTNVTDTSNPTDGTLKTTQTGSTTYAGVYTIKLDNPVDLEKGTNYSIVITFNNSVSVFCDINHTSGIITYKTDAQKGQSLYKSSSSKSWTDYSNSNGCFRIKGLTNSVGTTSTTSTPSLSSSNVTLAKTSYTYTGSPIEPSITVKYSGTTLKEGTDYSVSYSNNTSVGTATATVTGKGNYKGTVSSKFNIAAQSISGFSLSLSSTSYTYDGSAKKPTVTLKNGKSTISSSDYTVSYSSNTNAGTATAKVTGKGNYSGSVSKTYKINAKSISGFSATLGSTSYTYDGTAHKPSVVLKNGSSTISSSNYSLSYSNNTKAGTAKVTITGKGNYTGSLSKNFTIKAKSVSGLKYTSISNKTYTGKAIKPSITIKNGSTTLKSGTDYSVSYSNNKSTGKASIKVTGKGNYSGSTTKYFYIVPKKVTISKVTAAKKAATVKYKKATGASGYQIAYRVKGTSKWKTTTTTSLSKKLTGLTSKKTYQVKVRAYKTVSGKKYYGSYSSTKTVKVK